MCFQKLIHSSFATMDQKEIAVWILMKYKLHIYLIHSLSELLLKILNSYTVILIYSELLL
jgi:hypothetical protein